jgi:hypothetical protein
MLKLKDIDAGYSRDPMADWVVWTDSKGDVVEIAYGHGVDKATIQTMGKVLAELWEMNTPCDSCEASVVVDEVIITVLAARPGTKAARVLARNAI